MGRIKVSAVVNNEWLQRDINNLVATGQSIEQAIKSLPIGKYLRVDAVEAEQVEQQRGGGDFEYEEAVRLAEESRVLPGE